jgi:HEAT repeat protein
VVLRAVASADQTQGDVVEIRVRARGGARAQDLAPSDPGQAAAQEDVHLQEESDPAERREAYRQAVGDDVPPTREELTLALSAPATEDRIVAVPKVGMLAPGEAVAVLEDALSEDQDALVRSRAVAALTRLEGPAAGRLLRQRALEDADPDLRSQAINAIATSRGERSVNVLARAMREDPDPEIRRVAIQALGRVEGDWARRYLERAARTLAPELRSVAERALAARGEPAR